MSFIASTLHPARRLGVEHTKRSTASPMRDWETGSGRWDAIRSRTSILFRLYWRFSRALDFAPGTFPHLAAHQMRMMARPAVKRTCEIEKAIGYELPDWFPEKAPAA